MTPSQKLPIIAQRAPYKVTIEAGKNYAFCACGLSRKQPFCDGSHSGSGLAPQVFKAEETKEAFFCGCKHSKNIPFCDGSHSLLPEGK